MQAFFTVLLAAVFLRDRPEPATVRRHGRRVRGPGPDRIDDGGDLTPTALGLALAGAFSWAVGNVLVKRTSGVPVFPLVVWASLVPPLPALLVSGLAGQGPPSSTAILGRLVGEHRGPRSIWAPLATVMAYADWGGLLQRYPAAVVAPFALIAPCTGVLSSALIFRRGLQPDALRGDGPDPGRPGRHRPASPERRRG